MRRLVFCLALFLVTISAATGVHASTDCEKWLSEYRNSLAHSPAAHRVKAAHHRLHRYLHRKLATLKKPRTTPRPRLLPARHTRPKMTREELLKKLELACGDLPEDRPALAKLEDEPAPEFIPEVHEDGDPIELASNGSDGFLQPQTSPGYPGAPSGGFPGFGGFPGTPPIGGGGGRIPGSPTTPIPGCEINADVACTPTPNPPPIGETPEPGTFVLLATGLSGGSLVLRRWQTA